MYKRFVLASLFIILMNVMLVGCSSQANTIGHAKEGQLQPVDTGFTVTSVGDYDSADTAVIVGIDQNNKAVTLMNMDSEKQYTLYYDGTTYFRDKYEGNMSIAQFTSGQIVEVRFLKGKRQIANMQVSPDAWEYEYVDNYNLGGINRTASVGSATYSLPKSAVVISSEGRRADVMDIVDKDIITVRGVDHKIFSIRIEKGHGYLRLKNDSALIGGWIEVGNKVIREITEDMLLVVPEGKYEVSMMNGKASCKKEVTIDRNKEVVLDVGDVEIVGDKTGQVLFNVIPVDAKVVIDGTKTDISKPVELPYGIHQISIEAEGYDSLMKYIQVGAAYASIEFTLEEKKQDEPEDMYTTSAHATDSLETTENAVTPSTSNKVYIDAPKEVEVYLDGNYIGMSPVSFKKSVGSHTITLRKNGYKSRSYTVYLYNDGEDITYSFAELEKESSGNEETNTSSNSTRTTESGGQVEIDPGEYVSENDIRHTYH